ncbi:ABC transporter permease [Carboxylicivirga sp. N1Y90]|uniref:ABC transporter permease n=1 Tax=Carboxylicivirga fragile TaxID=3417571 RepID=UPI003D34798A|nr:ABC transporter permease [Marinilabiliaceae bacterium N1Y90]
MNKISLIIKREYITRVKKKSFVIMSIVGPLLFSLMIILPTWFASMDNTEEMNIAVVDQTNKYDQQIEDTEYIKFLWLKSSNKETLSTEYKEQGYDAYIVIHDDLLKTPDAINIYSDAQITMDVKRHISRNLEDFLEKEKLESYQIDGLDAIIEDVHNVDIDIKTIKLGDDGSEKESSTEITMVFGIIFALMVYMFVLMYGTQVMRGVMEEKTNRIVEVIISSVKPFQLMMGKIIGIAMVALTQFLIWVILSFGVASVLSSVFLDGAMPQNSQVEMVQGMNTEMDQAQTTEFADSLTKVFEKIDLSTLVYSLFAFMYLFIGGYLLYASLFAAIGAAVDSETDSQQFVLPIIMPLILSMYVVMGVFKNPGSDLAFWFSMIPFTSPVVMMARIPFEPPLWEVILSMVILTASFIFTTWFAGRIYRVGILMYGKKISYKELWKWFRYSSK